MILSQFKIILSENRDYAIEGGYEFTTSLYVFFYLSSFLLEMLNNYFNKKFYNKLPDDEKENFFVKVIRRFIDNTIPAVILFHNLEFISNIIILMKKIMDYYYDITASTSIYFHRFIRKVLSPTYLQARGITKIVEVYSYLSKIFKKSDKKANEIIEQMKSKVKEIKDIEKEQSKDKEFKETLKVTVEEVKKDIKDI